MRKAWPIILSILIVTEIYMNCCDDFYKCMLVLTVLSGFSQEVKPHAY